MFRQFISKYPHCTKENAHFSNIFPNGVFLRKKAASKQCMRFPPAKLQLMHRDTRWRG